MIDPIDRQAVLDIVCSNCDYYDENESQYDRIEKLPSVKSERKKGKWIRNDNGTWSCSKCSSWIPDEQHYYANYCLYCGAEMR